MKKEYLIVIIILFIISILIIYKLINKKDNFIMNNKQSVKNNIIDYTRMGSISYNNRVPQSIQNNNIMSYTSTPQPQSIQNNNMMNYTSIQLSQPRRSIENNRMLKFQNISSDLKNQNIGIPISKKNLKTTLKAIEPTFSVFLNNFLLYLFQKCNFCPAKELQISGICNNTTSLFNQRYGSYICKPIEEQKDCSQKKLDLPYDQVDYIINNFEYFNLILYKDVFNNILKTATSSKFFLFNTFKKLSWNNIKSINKNDAESLYKQNPIVFKEIYNLFSSTPFTSPDIEPSVVQYEESTTYLKYIFWYFRRAIVDTILSNRLKSLNILGISVGSTNLTSDYDMTLYGNSTDYLSNIMIYYKQQIYDIFHDVSEVVFDTNLYAMSSWIHLIDPELDINPSTGLFQPYIYDYLFSTTINTCSLRPFKVLLTGKTEADKMNTAISQHIWALVKLFICIQGVQDYDDSVYEFLMSKFSNITDINTHLLLLEAYKTISLYPQNINDLPYITNLIKLKPISMITPTFYNNFISFVSYNSPESYFTRGTFLDVVLNQQTCKNDFSGQLDLTDDEILDSFIENASELITYYRKDKYVNRARKAILDLGKANQRFKVYPEILANIAFKLESINPIQQTCNTTKINCTPFSIMSTVVDSILKLYVFQDIHKHKSKKVSEILLLKTELRIQY